MEAPAHIVEALKNIREGLHLRWNPKGKLLKAGGYDAAGKLKDPEWDPRWELWDTDPQGLEYMVMQLQEADESFRAPGDWLVRHMERFNPARYGGSIERMLAAVEAEAEQMRDLAEKDFDDLAGAVARSCADLRSVKSAAGLTFRGRRAFAPGM